MKKLYIILLIALLCACSSNDDKFSYKELDDVESYQLLANYLEQTKDGLYDLCISESEAVENGVSSSLYNKALSMVENINKCILNAQRNHYIIVNTNDSSIKKSVVVTRAMPKYSYTIDSPQSISVKMGYQGKIEIMAGSTQFVWGLYVSWGKDTSYFLHGTLYTQDSFELVGGPEWNFTMRKAVDSSASVYVTITQQDVMYNGLHYVEGEIFYITDPITGEQKMAVVVNGSIVIVNGNS